MNCPNCNSQVAPGIAFCPECGTRMPVSVAPPPPLRVLQDRYELQKKLGQGGMGSVYLAGDRRLSTVRWAVKEMSDAQITSPLERQQASEAFKHEAELLARLGHPNLPRVTDHFSEDGKNYLVMELVPGETLLDYVQRSGLPRPLAEVSQWAMQLFDVLTYLHIQNPPVIFRDLKPANVMITPEGTLKLIDFGIARLFKPGQARDTQAYGTMGYSAPEQYGRGQTDARSDVYSLGVLLHQLLTGYDPSSSPFRLPLADQLNPAVPPQLAAVLAQATDTDAQKRFAGMPEFRQAFLGASTLVQRQPQSEPLAAAVTGPTISFPGSQPFPAPVSAPAFQAPTTGLAMAALWGGIVSLVVMVIANLMMLVAVFNGGTENAIGGFGLLIAILPLLSAPVAAILGIIAMNRPETSQTINGRRHSVIGIVSGVVTLLLCCVIFYLVSIAPDSTDLQAGLLVLRFVHTGETFRWRPLAAAVL